MAIYGIGTDLVQVSRVAGVMERTKGRFAEKVLGADELRVYQARKARSEVRGLAFLATRFSAKEAFSKAMGTGLRHPVRWRHIIVGHDRLGKPEFRYSSALQPLIDSRSCRAHLSITDERSMACALVVLESSA